MNYRQVIHIQGRCLDDIFRLPCVHGIFKNDDGTPLFRVTLDTISERGIAVVGDKLCEDHEGRWHVLSKDEQIN